MPTEFRRYVEPFVGSGAVLATVAPRDGLAGDALRPLIDIWRLLKSDPEALVCHYEGLYSRYLHDPRKVYEEALSRYNADPNGPDLLFLCRTCYGGVVRFTRDGAMSTPLGPHRAISPHSLGQRMNIWRERVADTTFIHADFEETMAQARRDDLVYCDPPYVYSQTILYGSQDFLLKRLWRAIEGCKSRGARVMLSLDGTKKSGQVCAAIDVPDSLFKRELMLDCGRSMLRRFQKRGEDMAGEQVYDRLLLTW
jgi:DNA adenine methylase